MFRKLRCLFLSIIVTILPVQQLWSEPSAAVDGVVKANNTFALELYGRLAKRPGNLFFSPFSVNAACAMTCAGARGQTAVQMANTLHFPANVAAIHAGFGALLKELNESNASGCQLLLANSLWGQRDFRLLESFQQVCRDQYGAPLHLVDFQEAPEAARQQINSWVASQTQGRIEEMAPPGLVHRDTVLVLLNAIYFMGSWDAKFPRSETRNRPFHLDAEKTVMVPTMDRPGPFPWAETETLKVLEQPYLSNQLSMVIFLPKQVNGLAELERTLTLEQMEKLRRMCLSQEDVTYVYLPRFKCASTIDLLDVLKAMGMTDAFSPDQADFSGLTGKKGLWIEAAIHKACVEVDEEGTIAAAATYKGIP
ncbi:MAG TPA: serpin family protein, partial [Bacillota bacterium]|nr:serpin family protein [Bacillota bacterium]